MFRKIFKIRSKKNIISLKPMRLSYVNKNYLNFFNNPESKKFIKFNPKDLNHLKANVKKITKNKKILFLAIFIKNKHIGNIKIDKINYSNNSAVLGILIGNPQYRGKNIGYVVINFALKLLAKNNIFNIYLGCSKKNIQALNLYYKCGFKIFDKKDKYLILINSFVLNKIILGMAQFNSNYGITNFTKKKLNKKNEIKLLNYAYANHICKIDTSENYPVNLNKYGNKIKKFTINTKISSKDSLLGFEKSKKNYSNIKKIILSLILCLFMMVTNYFHKMDKTYLKF